MSVSVKNQNIHMADSRLLRGRIVHKDDIGSTKGYIVTRTAKGNKNIRVMKVSANNWRETR